MATDESRYSRQSILPEVGKAGQAALAKARVLCVGMGGLGSPSAIYLAGAGIGTLGVMDGDTVSLSNLHRQILYTTEEVGINKAMLAQKKLSALNPEIKIENHAESLAAENVLSIFSNYDLILDGTDQFETKLLINDACVKLGIPLVYASATQWGGEAGVFDSAKSACFRCYRPNLPQSSVQNCDEQGAMGPLIGMIGSLQALLTIQTLLGQSTPSILHVLDGLSLDWKQFHLKKNAACPTCSKSREEIVFSTNEAQACSLSFPQIENSVLRNQFFEFQKNHFFLDVRQKEEWEMGHLESAIHWPLQRLQSGEFPEIDKNRTILVYCQSGKRSKVALELLNRAGYLSLAELKYGFSKWNRV